MESCRIGIVHNVPPAGEYDFSAASEDVLIQVGAVEKALRDLNHVPFRIPFTKNLAEVIRILLSLDLCAVFNLCETVDEDPRFAGHPAAVLELLGIPFTGSPSAALTLSTDKVLSKKLLEASGIPTPRSVAVSGKGTPDFSVLHYPVLVKPRLEDGSIGIDQDSVFRDEGALRKSLEDLRRRFGDVLVEEYIEGREFNISLLGFPEPEVLPPAEIVFSSFPENLYRIVGYKAKWDPGSYEYSHTARIFPDLPEELDGLLRKTARASFDLFMLRDYGRVDIRVGTDGIPRVLEVNANPCISPDAGFPAAAAARGMDHGALVERMLAFVLERS